MTTKLVMKAAVMTMVVVTAMMVAILITMSVTLIYER